jgi:glutaminyl-peptide cyclotransferase
VALVAVAAAGVAAALGFHARRAAAPAGQEPAAAAAAPQSAQSQASQSEASQSQAAPPPVEGPPAERPAVERLTVEILAVHPHDREAFTQGLVWAGGGKLYESTGLYGASSLRLVDLGTGAVERRVELPPDVFGEGLALLPAGAGGERARLVQLSWREGAAAVWDAERFEVVDWRRYEGEGWGLCFDGSRLVMSDGTAELSFHEPASFAVDRRVGVTLDGQPLAGLNELECVDGAVWANVYTTATLARIDQQSGRVTATVDASALVERAAAGDEDVLNGIAHDPASGSFYLTGKRWPELFEVRFVPQVERGGEG